MIFRARRLELARKYGNRVGQVFRHGKFGLSSGTYVWDMIMVDIQELNCEEGEMRSLFLEGAH